MFDERSREEIKNPESYLPAAKAFIEDIKDKYSKKYKSTIKNYRESGKNFPEKVERHLEETNQLVPRTNILMGQDANEFLQKHSIQEIRDDELLLIYQLPKHLTQFWDKGHPKKTRFSIGADGDMVEEKIDIGGMAIEWSYFRNKLKGIVWETKANVEREFDVKMDTINPIGEHSDEYYYLFVISDGK